jgi:hypothetical protein
MKEFWSLGIYLRSTPKVFSTLVFVLIAPVVGRSWRLRLFARETKLVVSNQCIAQIHKPSFPQKTKNSTNMSVDSLLIVRVLCIQCLSAQPSIVAGALYRIWGPTCTHPHQDAGLYYAGSTDLHLDLAFQNFIWVMDWFFSYWSAHSGAGSPWISRLICHFCLLKRGLYS